MLFKATQILFLYFCLIGLYACDAKIDTTRKDNILIYCSERDPGILNPQVSANESTLDATAYTLFDRLIEIDEKTGKKIPSLAVRWTVSPDKKRYTFYLRKGVQFHHTSYFKPSRTMNSLDVVFSFKRIANRVAPFLSSKRTSYPLFDHLIVDNIDSIKAVGTYAVEFNLKKPQQEFFKFFTLSGAVVHSFEYAQYLIRQHRRHDLDLYPIGTGPFRLLHYQRYVSIRFEKNPTYWQYHKVKLDGLIYDITPKNRNRLAKLIQNDCDVVSAPKINDLPKLIQDKRFVFVSTSGMNTTYLAFNTKKPPFQRAEVRKAIALALNKQDIVKAIFYYTAQQAHSLLPPISWAYTPPQFKHVYDLEAAKALLQQQGVEDLSFSLWVDNASNTFNPSMMKTAAIIQSSLAKIGVKVILKSFNGTVFRQELENIDYDAVLLGWEDKENEPEFFYSSFFACKKSTLSLDDAWCDPVYDKLVASMQLTHDADVMKDLTRRAEERIYKQVPIIPITHSERVLIVNNRVKGLDISPFRAISFVNVKLENSDLEDDSL